MDQCFPQPVGGCLVPTGRVGLGAVGPSGSEQGISFPSCQQPMPNVPLAQGAVAGHPLARLVLPVATPWGQLPARDALRVLIRWKKIP